MHSLEELPVLIILILWMRKLSNFPTELVSGRPGIITQVCLTPKTTVFSLLREHWNHN